MDNPTTMRGAVAALETSLIRSALVACNGNVRASAAALGMPYRTMWSKLRKYQINPHEYRTVQCLRTDT
jgi:DNA-binding NtrC family response regulator